MKGDGPLADAGLPLLAVLDTSQVRTPLPGAARRFAQLLVFASAGSELWQRIRPIQGEDPIDQYSIGAVEDYLRSEACSDYEVIYPSASHQVDLRALGSEIGWHQESRLGIGIDPQFGTWFAYRVVVAADTALPLTRRRVTENACDNCAAKPCIAACPAGAISASRSFDLEACARERLRDGSGCALRCIARSACPVGSAYQYQEDQLNYHYRRSLAALRRYHGQSGTLP